MVVPGIKAHLWYVFVGLSHARMLASQQGLLFYLDRDIFINSRSQLLTYTITFYRVSVLHIPKVRKCRTRQQPALYSLG